MKNIRYYFIYLLSTTSILCALANPVLQNGEEDYIIEFVLEQAEPLTANITYESRINNTYQLSTNTEGGTPKFTYLWSPASGLSNPKIANPILLAEHAESYTLQITDSKGCYIMIEFKSPLTFLKSIEKSQNKVKVYTDEKSENIHIIFNENTSKGVINLFNLNGGILLKQEFDNKTANEKIILPIDHLTKDVYIINIQTSEYLQSEKII